MDQTFTFIDLIRRANNTEVMLTEVNMSLPDMMVAVLAMDDSVLDVDHIKNLIKFCPTKKEIELLKNYNGDKTSLGKCEQYFLELMKVPRVDSKLIVFSFKIQFSTQIREIKKSLNAVNSAYEEVRTSQKLKEIMRRILYLGNTMNQGTMKGAAVGFKLESLWSLSYTRAVKNKMSLMHYLCKVLDSKAPDLLDFHKDLESLESASKIQFKSLTEEMQTINKGLEKLNQEFAASESDGPVSEVFRQTLKDFISSAETEVAIVGRNLDALSRYFGEDPKLCSFEEVIATLLSFIKLFKKAHKENVYAIHSTSQGQNTSHSQASHISSPLCKSSLKTFHWVKLTRVSKGSLWEELKRQGGEGQIALEFDVSDIETLFPATVQKPVGTKPERVQLIDSKRSFKTEIMLTTVKMSLPDMMATIMAMDDSVLDVDQIENLIKFFPTKEEIELLQNYIGDKATLGKCEQYFLELMKVPGVESKLRVFSFKIQFGTQIKELRTSLNVVNSACKEVRTSKKLKIIMKEIISLENTMIKKGTRRGSAVGFKITSLPRLCNYKSRHNSKMTFVHYLCKNLASKAPDLLDFHKDLESLESASKIKPKYLDEEMQAITKGLETLNQELTAPESDGPVSEVFHKTLKDFISSAETEVATLSSFYSLVGKNADALVVYFGVDPNRNPFTVVTSTLLSFISLFKKAHEETVDDVNASAMMPFREKNVNSSEEFFEVEEILSALIARFDPMEAEIHSPPPNSPPLGQSSSHSQALIGSSMIDNVFVQITELKTSLNVVNSAFQEVHTSQKLKGIMKKIISLENRIMNRSTRRGSVVGCKLKSLLRLCNKLSPNNKMTLIHYFCKVLDFKAPGLLDFHKDLESLESASKIQLESLAEEIQALIKGLEKLKQELVTSESDGHVSEVFHKKLKDFIPIVETEVPILSSLYSEVQSNADELVHYFGEHINYCTFEEVIETLFSFTRLFKEAHQENVMSC